jgi:hypothetical protein
VLRHFPALGNHACPAQMLAATICNYIKANPGNTPFAKVGSMTFGLKEQGPTPLANPHFI